MVTRARHGAARALADLKGATALEYALISASLAATIMAAFNAFAGRFGDFLAGIVASL